MSNILLIHPATDGRYAELNVGYRETPPPLGLVLLGNVLRNEFPHLGVRILDGNYFSTESIKQILDDGIFDFVGLSDWFTNHENCLTIARYAKSTNPVAKVALGGPNAGHLARQILNNNGFIDYVVNNDGEDAIKALVEGKTPSRVPNLYYRSEE